MKIEQYGWNDYWSKLVTGFISDTAPDVFTGHSSKYPLFADKGQVLPIDDYVAKDNVDLSIYQKGLADRWIGADGKRYGLPKDWDTEVYFYNSAFTEAAGITTEQLNSMTWNPQDGGTFEQIVRRLTVDSKGRRGDQPGFDKDDVKVYGLGYADAGGGDGQTSWSWYAAINGWKYSEGEPWGTKFFYGDPKFTDTIGWWRGLITKGYMPTYAQAKSGVDVTTSFGAGKYGMTPNGLLDARDVRRAEAGEDQAGPAADRSDREADVDDERARGHHLGRYDPAGRVLGLGEVPRLADRAGHRRQGGCGVPGGGGEHAGGEGGVREERLGRHAVPGTGRGG